VSFKFL